MNLIPEAQSLFPYTQSFRRDFHRHPEIGYQEKRTSGIITQELVKLGLSVTTGVGQTGVVGLLAGEKLGAVILLRFDMDALPIQEETAADYASQNLQVMHACGHDGHMAVGLSVAKLLAQHKNEINGTVKFIFQPAEEGVGLSGAEAMIADGVLDDPAPNYALAMHVWNDKPLKWFGITPGPMLAGAEAFKIRIVGKGGHAALPHLSVDPVIAAGQVINALQGIVARNVSPLQTAVVSVTMVHGGEAFNVIPTGVELQGTIRTFDPDIRQLVLHRFRQIIEGISAASGCTCEIELRQLTPALVNDPILAKTVADIASRSFPDSTVDDRFQIMVSEDMAYILEKVPGCLIFVGSANAEKGLNYPHHHPKFDFDERALVLSTVLLAETTLELLKNHK